MNKIEFYIDNGFLNISLLIDAELLYKYENHVILKEGINTFKLYNNNPGCDVDYSIYLPNHRRKFRILIGEFSSSKININRFTIFENNNFEYIKETDKYMIKQNINFGDRTKEEVLEYINDIKAGFYLLSKHYKSQINDIHTIK